MAAPLFLSAQETYPLTKYLGQFFEQGYGNEGDEENLDLAAEGQKLYHAGWSYTLPEGFDTTSVHYADYSQFNLDATFRLTDKIGEQQWQVRVPGPQDEVARGIIPSINPDFNMAAVVRQTDLYRPQEWVRPADQLYLYLLDAGGTYDPLYVHEEQGLAPVDIQTGEDPSGLTFYYVLANAMDENQFTYPTLLKVSSNGNLIWQRDFKIEGMNVLSHELVITENQELFFPVNYVDEGLAGVIGFNTAGQQLNDPQHVPTEAYLYGIAADGSNRLWTAGYEFSEPADTNALISRFTANGLYDQHWQKGNNQGQQKFRDLVLHDQGLQALGTRTDTTEGSASVYVSHLDNQVNEYYYDVMGSSNRDRVSSLILKPDAPVTTFAGRHTGYGVYESGNAYLGGILLQNPFMNGSTCKLPRFIYVTLMESYKDSTGQRYLDPANSILTNPSKEADLLNYLVTNNIDFVKAFGIIKIFDLDVYDVPSNPNYTISGIRQDLNDFIKTLRDTGIIVGSVVGTYDNSFLYHVNLFQANVANQTNNYNSAGKINFLSYEYEFWNRLYDDGNEFLHGFDKGGYHVEGWLDMLGNLDTLNTEGAKSANQWEIYAYIGCFNALTTNIPTTPAQQLDTIYKYRQKQYLDTNYQYYTGFGDWNSDVKSHVINWRSQARKLEQKTDALFMYYGTPHYDSTNFINTGQANLSDMPMSNVIGTDQRKNLSILGSGSGTTEYIPIFYNTYDKLNNGTVVCNSAFENLLGDWLENHPDNVSQSPNPKDGNTYREAEARFLQQYDLVYDHVVTNNNGSIPANSNSDPDLGLPSLQDIEIIATSWFIYHDCYANNLFTSSSNYAQVSCQNLPFTDPIDTASTNTDLKDIGSGEISLYPNPNKTQTFFIRSEAYGLCRFDLYDLRGRLIMNKSLLLDGSNSKNIKIDAPPGTYIYHIYNREELSKVGKIILK